MKHLFPIRLARPAALALLVGLVCLLGIGGTAWAGLGEPGSSSKPGKGGTVPPRTADVSIVKTGTWSDKDITFTLTVGNAGPVVATRVVVGDSVPADLTIKSVSTSKGKCTYKGNAVGCNLGDLAKDGTATITIKTRLKNTGARKIVNVAVVDCSVRESNYSNNVSTLVLKRP